MGLSYPDNDYLGLLSRLRNENRVADAETRQQLREAVQALRELLMFVTNAPCDCFDENDNPRSEACRRCRLLAKFSGG